MVTVNEVKPMQGNLVNKLLLIEIVLAVACVVVGGVLYLLHNGGLMQHYHVFSGTLPQLRTPGGIADYAIAGHARGIIQLGILLLIINPVLRVITAAASFARQRDLLYVIVSLIVLGILLYNMLGVK